MEEVEKYDYGSNPAVPFDLDDIAFQCDPGSSVVICCRSDGNPYKKTPDNVKACYTTLACCSANGDYLPLHVLYKAERMISNWTKNGPPGTTYDVSPSGWMETEQFERV